MSSPVCPSNTEVVAPCFSDVCDDDLENRPWWPKPKGNPVDADGGLNSFQGPSVEGPDFSRIVEQCVEAGATCAGQVDSLRSSGISGSSTNVSRPGDMRRLQPAEIQRADQTGAEPASPFEVTLYDVVRTVVVRVPDERTGPAPLAPWPSAGLSWTRIVSPPGSYPSISTKPSAILRVTSPVPSSRQREMTGCSPPNATSSLPSE
jgi:hypothetical protein